MRILQVVTRSESGGAQSLVRGLAETFVERGHQTMVAAGLEGEWKAFSGMNPNVLRHELPDLVRALSPARELRALLSLRALYKSWKPDIVHLHTSKAAALGRLAGVIPPNHIVYTMHGYDQLRLENRRFLSIDKLLRLRTGAIVAVSRNDQEAMSIDGYASHLIFNGVFDATKESLEDPIIIDRLSKLRASGKMVVVTIARDARPKRIDLTRQVAEILRGQAQIAWIGGDPRSGDPENFHALGVTANASAYLKYADLFLLLSDHEGLPISLLEAMSSGIPSVVSDVGGLSETLVGIGTTELKKGSTFGFLVKDVEAAAAAIAQLSADPVRLKRMGTIARQIWLERYSIDSVATSYLDLYTSLLG